MSQISQDFKYELKYKHLSAIDNKLLTEIKAVIFHTDEVGSENIIITKSDDVFGFGTNNYGRLGLGTHTKVETPTIIPELSAKKVINVRFGFYSSYALTESGDVYSAGFNNYGILGNGLNGGSYNKPKKINLNPIIDIKCCNSRTILLTQTNQIYWFGYHNSIVIINTPKPLNNQWKVKIIQISSGKEHSIAVTDTGKCYSWGKNSFGELGVGQTTRDSDSPQQIQIPNKLVKKISCGYNHTLILTSNGDIYSVGSNYFGQLGTGNISKEYLPKCVTLVSEKFIDIFAVNNISMSLTENQSFYVWGQTIKNDKVLTPLKTNLNSFQEVIDFYSEDIITYKPLTPKDIFNKIPLNRVIQAMGKAFNDPNESDIKFKIKRKGSNNFGYIYAFKWFIEKNSEYFKKMFANEWIENQSNEIVISGYSYEPYFHYIKSLYTDYIETEDFEVLTELLSITEEYLDENIKLKCVEKIKPLTTPLNVCTLYSFALKYRSKELEDFCFEIMSKNIKSIVESKDYKLLDGNDAKHFLTKCARQINY